MAKRVDSLRETLADLKKQEDDHIRGMKDRIASETHEAEINLRVIRSEIAELEMRKSGISESLKASEEIEQSRMVIQKGLERLREREERTKLLNKESKDRLAMIKIREKELTSALSRTDYK